MPRDVSFFILIDNCNYSNEIIRYMKLSSKYLQEISVLVRS